MRKTALKAALVAFISIIAALFLLTGIVSLSSPKTMASFCDSVGLKSASVYYYRADYERDADFYKLADLVDAADYADDDRTLAEYGEKFVLSHEFKEYCAKKDEDTSPAIKTEYYYSYLVVRALFSKNDLRKSASLAADLTEVYEKNCPLYVAVMTALSVGDKEYARAIKTEMISGSFSDPEGLLQDDINKLGDLIDG